MQEIIFRRAPRYPVHLPITEMNGYQAADCHLLDLSAWGSLMESPFPLHVGDEIHFSFAVPEHGPRSIRGEVEWIRPALHKDGFFLMGLSFFEADWECDRLGQKLYFGQDGRR